MNDEEVKTAKDALVKVAATASFAVLAYTMLSLSVKVAWDSFASDMHLPQLSTDGALGIVWLVLIVVGLLAGTYTLVIRDWGE